MRSILGLLAALTAAGPVGAALNLLPNPGFESGTTKWTLYVNSAKTTATGTPEAVMDVDAAALHEGAQGLSVSVTGINGNNWDVQLQPPQTWKAEKGKIYHLTFWGKADTSRKFAVAASLGPKGNYTYLTSWNFGLGKAWKQYEVFYTSPATGIDSLRLNLYLGAEKGSYSFDDFVLDTVPSALPASMVQPAQGAWYTGVHRNLFQELGYSKEAIDAKVKTAFEQLFVSGDSANERLFYLAPDDTSTGFINASGYALTEGTSYGMMIALQMDRQDLFRKIWKFCKVHMQQKSGDRQGYFSWKVSVKPPYTPADLNPAPDGEEWYVSALFLAARRWGNDTGMFDYQAQADSLLGYMTKVKNATMYPLIDPDRKQIVFSPVVGGTLFTDPSYHLPGFYRMWDAFATDKKGGLYAAMADTSWALLKRASYGKSGLFPDYSTFDGAPQATSFNKESHTFNTDAHRVGSHIGFSWAWFMDDTGATRLVGKELGFFAAQAGGYKAQYKLENDSAMVTYNSESLLSSNAGAVLASTRPSDWSFVDALWKTPTPSGTYRYYNGLLTMLNLLHCSGNFKAWGSPGLVAHPELGVSAGSKSASLRMTQHAGRVEVRGVSGTVRLLDAKGVRVISAEPVAGQVSLSLPGRGVWIVDAGAAGARKVVVP